MATEKGKITNVDELDDINIDIDFWNNSGGQVCEYKNTAGVCNSQALKSLEAQFEAQCRREDDAQFWENLKGFDHWWARATSSSCPRNCQTCFEKRESERRRKSDNARCNRNAEKLRLRLIYEEQCRILGLRNPRVMRGGPKLHSDSETDDELVDLYVLENPQ